jgi:nucleoprotein TPR
VEGVGLVKKKNSQTLIILILNIFFTESSEEAISRLSPLAASTSKLLKSGLTLTQLYTQYAQITQELLVEKQETKRLTEYINKIMEVCS